MLRGKKELAGIDIHSLRSAVDRAILQRYQSRPRNRHRALAQPAQGDGLHFWVPWQRNAPNAPAENQPFISKLLLFVTPAAKRSSYQWISPGARTKTTSKTALSAATR